MSNIVVRADLIVETHAFSSNNWMSCKRLVDVKLVTINYPCVVLGISALLSFLRAFPRTNTTMSC